MKRAMEFETTGRNSGGVFGAAPRIEPAAAFAPGQIAGVGRFA